MPINAGIIEFQSKTNLHSKGAFQVNTDDKRKHSKSKRKLTNRLRNIPESKTEPMFTNRKINYEISDRINAIHCGGIGAVHMLAKNTGLVQKIDENLNLLKIHLPYHESDHVLNMCYNIIAGGRCIEDLEVLRLDPDYMNALETERIPDPTTAGDFLRRFTAEDIESLMDSVNDVRVQIWNKQSSDFRKRGILNIDATIEETTGDCKQGMGMSYDGRWSYAPLIVSLHNTREHLFVENRPGNAHSSRNAAKWIDKGGRLLKRAFKEVWFRGDSAYNLTKEFDRWTDEGYHFAFGCDARKNLCGIADEITDWRPLCRRVKHPVKTTPRRRPENVKARIVKEKEYKSLHLEKEEIAEFDYRPTHCDRSYRMVVIKKTITVSKGQAYLFDDIRYFFYITNDRELSSEEVVYFCNDRCDHENDIEQLRNGIHALKMPTGELLPNWAYMVIASLAWTLKAWMGLLMPHRATGYAIIRMEFRRFLNMFINVPAQIIRHSRQLTYRLLGYMKHAPAFFGFVRRCQRLRL
ncbi:MAG: IS1380 family transposase [Chitinivibrionales bacterium]|nr:IS1380 family transposase [Chitinivibrionales bacterium]